MIVICTNKVYIDNHPIDVYKVGNKYESKYLFDRVMISDSVVIEFEWMVYVSDQNHYQFTDKDFKTYFIDLTEDRDKKISDILIYK